jgi:hypothetical protein
MKGDLGCVKYYRSGAANFLCFLLGPVPGEQDNCTFHGLFKFYPLHLHTVNSFANALILHFPLVKSGYHDAWLSRTSRATASSKLW